MEVAVTAFTGAGDSCHGGWMWSGIREIGESAKSGGGDEEHTLADLSVSHYFGISKHKGVSHGFGLAGGGVESRIAFCFFISAAISAV